MAPLNSQSCRLSHDSETEFTVVRGGMEAGPRLHPVTQRPLTAAPADLRRLPADPRSAAGRQAGQAAATDQLNHLRSLPEKRRTVKRMVGPPRRATHAAAAEAGPACARPTPAHEAPAPQPAYWLAQRAAPACLAPRPRTAPRTPSAVGQRLLDARCMLLLLLPPSDPSASGECPHELLIVSGLSPSTKRNQAFGPPQGYALLTARCEPHCHCRVCHPLTAYTCKASR